MIDNNTLYGIVGTLLFTSFVLPFLRALFGPDQGPKLRWLQVTTLPSMNRFDLTHCLSTLGTDPLSSHIWLVGYDVIDGVAKINLGYLNQGEEYKHIVTCRIDNSLPPRYPLSKRK